MFAGDSHACDLSFHLHAAQTSYAAVHSRWSISWRYASADRLGCCARQTRSGSLGALWNSFSLAIPALYGDCLDVSRRLRSRRIFSFAVERAARPLCDLAIFRRLTGSPGG